MTCQSHSGQKYSPLHKRSASNVASAPERRVRFTEQFFDRINTLLPDEHGADGTPSITDFLLLDLSVVRDRLAADYEGHTLATDDEDIRVCIGSGVLVDRFAIDTALEADIVEAFGLSIELHRSDNPK